MAASTTKNYNWTEIDPDGEIDIATDVNTPLEQIDASLKELQDSASTKTYTFEGGLTENNGVVALDLPIANGTEGRALIANYIDTVNRTKNIADHYCAFASGYSTQAIADCAHAEGELTVADGESAHAEGSSTKAYGEGSHSEGMNTECNGGAACHAEGHNTSLKGEGYGMHVEGESCTIDVGDGAPAHGTHAEGYHCKIYLYEDLDANPYYSTDASGAHAEGYYSIAGDIGQHAGGTFNKEHLRSSHEQVYTDSSILEVIGNGTAENKRSDARTLDRAGNGWFAGDLTCDAVQGNHDKLYSLRQVAAFVETLPAMEFGTSNTVTVPAVSQATVDVTFGSAKTEAPVLFVNLQHSAAYGDLTWYVQSVTNQQAAIVVVNNGSEDATDITVDWLAISGR